MGVAWNQKKMHIHIYDSPNIQEFNDMKLDFPDPYPEETFFSICARYGERMDFPQEYMLVESLFGSSQIKAVTDFPSRLNQLVPKFAITNRYSIEYFINWHTVFPLFQPFLTKSNAKLAKEQIYGERTRPLHVLMGITGTDISLPTYLRYCPVCVKEQMNLYGEAYWQRNHQISGVFVCPIHHIWLEESRVLSQGQPAFFCATQNIKLKEPRKVNLDIVENQFLIELANSVLWILQKQPDTHLDSVRSRYHWMLAERKLASYSGRIHRKDLLNAFAQYFGEAFLQQVECSIVGRNIHNWLMHVIKGRHNQHPLRHLLLIAFLKIPVQEFFNAPEKHEPFGRGPWPCLNPICAFYRQDVIPDYSLGYNRGSGKKPLGTFLCQCGFTYSRVGPDKNGQDKYRIGRIRSYGHVWESKLTELWNDSSHTITGTSKRMRCDLNTIKRQAHRLGLLPSDETGIQTKESNILTHQEPPLTESNREKYRRAWLDALALHPNHRRNQIKELYSEVYLWLNRYDAEWLATTKPKPKGNTEHLVSWENRDITLAKRLPDAIYRLKQNTTPATRITKNRLIQELGISKNWFNRDLAKLPQTVAILEKHEETHEEFALRRLEMVIEVFQAEGESMTRSNLIKQAGISLPLQTRAINTRIHEALNND